MNPSTAELLDAVGRVNASAVVILPNNRNIIMAAQQVIDVADRPVAVIPTTAVPQSFAALLTYDGASDLDAIAAEMTEAAMGVRSAEVTTAIKDSKGKVGAIKAGQVIGIVDHKIEVVGEDVAEVTSQVVKGLLDGGETITVLAGEEFDDAALEALIERLSAEYPMMEVEGHRGEQPVYPVIVAVE
jgi:dihydroxyacetone kinase-like predicted kinase